MPFLIRRTLLDRFNGQAESWPASARGLDRHPSVARYVGVNAQNRPNEYVPLKGRRRPISRVWNRPWPKRCPNSMAEAPPNWYVARAATCWNSRSPRLSPVESVDDSALHEAAHQFIMKSRMVRTRVRRYADQLDRRLAQFIRSDLQAFEYGKQITIRILPALCQPAGAGWKAGVDPGHGWDGLRHLGCRGPPPAHRAFPGGLGTGPNLLQPAAE